MLGVRQSRGWPGLPMSFRAAPRCRPPLERPDTGQGCPHAKQDDHEDSGQNSHRAITPRNDSTNCRVTVWTAVRQSTGFRYSERNCARPSEAKSCQPSA